MSRMDRNTILFNSPDKGEQQTTEDILKTVYDALEEKGYNAIDQMVGYILSGDPSYITGHNNARNIIRHIERDDLVEELLRAFLKK
ncbi:IreB family regulatory phosphoprotein [Anoxybacterium hadale]